MTLQSLKIYGYIGSKTKSYQTKKISSTIYLPTLQTLALKLHVFRLFLSSTKTQFAQVSDPRICPNNLNRTPFAESLASYSMPKPLGSTRATNFSCYCVMAIGAIHSPGSLTRYIQQAVLSPPAWWFHRPRTLCGLKTLFCHIASHQPGWGIDWWMRHQLTVVRL